MLKSKEDINTKSLFETIIQEKHTRQIHSVAKNIFYTYVQNNKISFKHPLLFYKR